MSIKQNALYIGCSLSFHDSAIAVVDGEGELLFAEATERSIQFKKALEVRPDLIGRCKDLIQRFGKPGCEAVVGINWSHRAKAEFARLGIQLADQQASLPRTDAAFPIKRQIGFDLYTTRAQVAALEQALWGLQFDLSQDCRYVGRELVVHAYDHHLTHAAYACYSSPYESAACAIVDGSGEGRACSFFDWGSGKIEELNSDDGSHEHASLGYLYWWLCQSCGFGLLGGEEWKVMGLAAYGKSDAKLESMLSKTFAVDELVLKYRTRGASSALLYNLYQAEKQGERDPSLAPRLAHAGQRVFTDLLMQLLDNLAKRTGKSALTLAGGCALNSSAVGLITERTAFKNIYVPSAPGDDGTAVGAAILAARSHGVIAKPKQFYTPFLGDAISEESVEAFIKFSKPTIVASGDEVFAATAKLLSQGAIVAVARGRAEFGPRALGNRSILGDPRLPNLKALINSKIKFREEFRPFAPAVLHEFGPTFFENYEESRYMERTLRFRESVKQRVPGVVHLDGTGRLQSVKKEWYPDLHRIIDGYREITGIPMLLNTSFNVMGKPIVHSVEDAVSVFYTTGLDAMLVGKYLISK